MFSGSDKNPSLQLKFTNHPPKTLLISILKNLGITLEHASNSNEINTHWISWYYDKESKQSQSNPRNNYFSLDFRDRYRFTFVVSKSDNHSDILVKKIERSEEKDIRRENDSA